jgi:hypothetical protein
MLSERFDSWEYRKERTLEKCSHEIIERNVLVSFRKGGVKSSDNVFLLARNVSVVCKNSYLKKCLEKWLLRQPSFCKCRVFARHCCGRKVTQIWTGHLGLELRPAKQNILSWDWYMGAVALRGFLYH